MLYARTLKVQQNKGSLYITCNYFVAPIGEEIFSVLGEDRVLYIPIDSEIGKEYAVRVVKKRGWNVRKLRVGRTGKSAVYFIPKSFTKSLGIAAGEYVLALGRHNTLEIIPLKITIQKLGKFREPTI